MLSKQSTQHLKRCVMWLRSLSGLYLADTADLSSCLFVCFHATICALLFVQCRNTMNAQRARGRDHLPIFQKLQQRFNQLIQQRRLLEANEDTGGAGKDTQD